MAKLSVIQDPVTKQKFARDIDTPGSLYEAYNEPTQSPVAPVAQAPVPSPVQIKRTVDPSVQAAESYLGTFTKPQSQAQIAEEMRRGSQALIDSINKVHDDQVAQAKKVGDERLAMDNAVSVLSGLTGSTEAGRTRGKTLEANEKEIAAINNQRGLELSRVYTKITQDARDEARRQKEDATKSAEDILKRRTESQAKAVENLKLMAQGGLVDFESFKASPQNSEVYNYALDAVGGSEEALRGLFAVNRPIDQLVGSPTRIGGKYVQAYQNPLTGKVSYETLALPEGLGETYNNFQKIGDSLIAIPDDWDGDTSKLRTIYGGTASGGSNFMSGGSVPIAAQGTNAYAKDALVQDINKLKLNEGQANAASYAIRLIEANKNINDLIGGGYNPTTVASAVGRGYHSDNARNLSREMENFIRAQLRKESGATITPEELAGGKNIYDPSGVMTNQKDIDQTGATRQQAIQSMIAQAGPAGHYLNEYFKSQGLGGSAAASTSRTLTKDGQSFDASALTDDEYQQAIRDGYQPR